MLLGSKTRWATGIFVLALTSTMLTACSAMSGATSQSAVQAVNAINGLSDAAIRQSTIDQTFGSKNMMTLRANVDGALADDKAELARRLLDIAYSVGDKKPTSGISVELHNYDSNSLGQALQDSGWEGVVYEPDVPGEFFVTWPVLEDRFGKWPGKAVR